MDNMKWKPIRILIADDEPAMLDAYRKILDKDASTVTSGSRETETMRQKLFGSKASKLPLDHEHAFEVVYTSGAEAGVNAVRCALEMQRPFALAFIDMRMPPGPDGVWAAKQIRLLDPNMDLVIATAFSDVDPREISAQVPPIDKMFYVQKPFHPFEISQLAVALGRKSQAEARNQELQAQLLQARKMEAIGLLAGGVAHDLNNILSGIVSYPEVLLKNLDESSAMREPLSIIQKSGEKAAAVVGDLLTIARSGIASMEIVNLSDIISEYVNSPECKNLLNYHPHVHIDIQSEGVPANISGSVVHLSKILMNLAANAAEAMPKGGIIRIITENKHIDDQTEGCEGKKTGEYVLLTVADSGIGISPEDQVRIFEPFFTRKAMGRSGTGLGMTVVWQSMADHHGFIDVESTIGVGTTFRLYFPAVQDKQMPKLADLSMDRYLSCGETILVVDDMEDQRIIASAILDWLGYTVVTVSSGEEAIDFLKGHSVDLIILDMIMGEGLNGRQTYELILKMLPGQKAIIASGYADSEDVRKAREIGASRFVIKPYTLESIGVALKDALAEGAAQMKMDVLTPVSVGKALHPALSGGHGTFRRQPGDVVVCVDWLFLR